MAILVGKPKFEEVGDMHIWLEPTKSGQVKLMSNKVGSSELCEEITIWSDGKMTISEKNLKV